MTEREALEFEAQNQHRRAAAEQWGGVMPPKPDDVALAFAAALLSSGRYGDDNEAAIVAAWSAVPAFYVHRVTTYPKVAGMFFVPYDQGAAFESDGLEFGQRPGEGHIDPL